MDEPKRKRGNPKWVKGVSGNPKGCPPTDKELRDGMRLMAPIVLMRVQNLLNSDDESIRLQTSKLVLDRGYGKALESIDVTSQGGPITPKIEIVEVIKEKK